MERIVIVGSSGSGKTTLGRRVSEALNLPRLELDSAMHRDGWMNRQGDPFRTEVAAFAAGPRWVVDGNYRGQGTQDLLWPRADTIVWLDLPRWLVVRRVAGRTLRRVLTREELWDGVREPWSNLYSLNPEHNIVVWSYTHHASYRATYEEAVTGDWKHATVHRLRTPAAVDQWLAKAAPAGTYRGTTPP